MKFVLPDRGLHEMVHMKFVLRQSLHEMVHMKFVLRQSLHEMVPQSGLSE